MNNDEKESRENFGIVKFFILSPIDLIRAYRWTVNSSWRSSFPSHQKEITSWWKLLLASSVALTIATVLGFICTVNINVFSINSVGGGATPIKIISEISGGASRLGYQLRNQKIGEEIFVVLTSALAWFTSSATLSAIFSFLFSEKRAFKRVFARECYEISVLTARASIVWIGIAAIAFLIESIFHPFRDARVYWKWMALVIAVSISGVSVCVLIWAHFDRLSAWKYQGWRKWLMVLIAWLMPVMAVTLCQMGLIGGSLFPPGIQISASPKCDPNECYVYVRSENLQQVVIDLPITFKVDLTYIKRGSSEQKKIPGMAEILLSSVQPGAAPATLDPDAEQILKVQRVSLTCKLDSRGDAALIPHEMVGSAYVYVTNHATDDARAPVEIKSTGNIFPLFRNAQGGCPVGL